MRKFLIIAMLTIVSCAPKNIQGTLDTVEVCIESRPDSAKSLLESIKLPLFATRELKARNALLNTIALDKNYIDVTTDSIIAPAVRYYTRRGTPDARFKTQYYLGRIRQNAGDNEAALDCFVKASALEPEVTDTLVLARCYSAQGVIYSDFYDYENAIEANRKAADLFLAVGNINSYVNRVLQESFCWWALNDLGRMKDCLDKAGMYKDKINTEVLSSYYSRLINYLNDNGLSSELIDILKEYTECVPTDEVNWNVVSSAYMDLGDLDKADHAVRQYMLSSDFSEEKHYALTSRLFELKGEYKESLQAYKTFIEITDSAYQETFVNNIRLLEERNEKEMRILEAKNRTLILILILIFIVILLIALVFTIIKHIKENRELKALFTSVEKEKQSLENMLKTSMLIDTEIRRILSDRIELLNEIALSHRIPRSEKVSSSQKKIDALLNDTKEYLSTIGMTYVVKNPEIVSFLKTKDLTTWEIGYCCLYVMGYNAKEISGIMKNNQVYKISSRIREKLGLEGGKVRLETYLKTLFAQG